MRFSPIRSPLGAAAVAAFLLSLKSTSAGPLVQAEVTKVINQVSLIDPQKGERPAAVQDIIRNDLGIETGKKSRSELLFQDATLTRLGAETFFSFKTGTRDLTLEKGSMLLQVPKGLGGATIHTAAVTAAITGTTIMMEYIPNQYIKVLVLEGSLRLSRNGVFGDSLVLRPGKMVIMRPDARRIPDPVDVDLEHITKTSSLVNFPGAAPLPSTPLMQAAIDDQKAQLASKDLVPTNFVMGHGTNVAVVPLYTPSGVAIGVITTAGAMPGVAIKASVSGASNAGASVLRSAIDPVSALVGNVSGSSSSTLSPTISTVNDLLGTTTGTVDSLASNVLGSSASLTSVPITSTVSNLLGTTTGTVNTVTSSVLGTTLATVDSLTSNVLVSPANVTSVPLTSAVNNLLGNTTGTVNTVTSDLLGSATGTVNALASNVSGASSNAMTTPLTATVTNLLGGTTGTLNTVTGSLLGTTSATVNAGNPAVTSVVTNSPVATAVVTNPGVTSAATNLVGSVTTSPTNLLGSTLTHTTTSLTSLLPPRH